MSPVSKIVRILGGNWWFACFLLLQVAGIGQLYPYVHLHHVHDDDGARVVLSIHPPLAGDDHISATSEDEHHHDIDHVVLDCNLCQRLLNQLQRQADILVFLTPAIEPDIQALFLRQTADPPPLINSRSIQPSDFRGPPAII